MGPPIIVIFAACLLHCSAQFVDEMQVYEGECLGEDRFPCMSGGCILQSQYCDGRVDCEDGTDENFCAEHKPDMEFCNATHQFMCRDDQRCIPNVWICNNETDCRDGSDEVNCTALPEYAQNATCKGFVCGDGKCISNLWVCDGVYDCEDRSDEYAQDMCRHTLQSHTVLDGQYCQELVDYGGGRSYKCLDSSFCLPSARMCDGMRDCKDGSDEGPFCANWHTMCTNQTCVANGTQCSPERAGPACVCDAAYTRQYNAATKRCEDVDECLLERPQCSHACVNGDGHFVCECDEGYVKDRFGYLCYATGPEPMLFFSTRKEIKYLKIKSKQLVTVAKGIKQAHGVTSDGIYLYWAETAAGHQAVVRAQLNDVQGTKEVIVGLGLEDPGDIAVDWLGGHIYFSDAERGVISACYADGSVCTTIHTETKHPRFVTIDVKNGQMYWADWHNRPLIMTSKMDGSGPEVLVDNMSTFPTGLTIDAPNGRLYYVEKTIKVITLNGKLIYSLFEEPFHHPYSIAVFENTVFWSDWTSNTIQTTDKLHSSSQKRDVLISLDTPVLGMHMFHPVLMPKTPHPCQQHPCSHFCFITSRDTHSCGCPDHMEIKAGSCHQIEDYRQQYLIVGGGQLFTRIKYDTLGNAESHATHFDIGRVQAMAYDSTRDTLYIYDGQRRTLDFVNMSDFTLGRAHTLVHQGLENVVDMDYDHASDCLYLLDAGRRCIEVISLRSLQRAFLYRFQEQEIPIGFCLLPNYGRMLVAVVESEDNNNIYVDSIGMDGEERVHIIMNDLKGPHVRLRYAHSMDNVYLSDEGNGAIDYLHPAGTGRENFRELSTTVTSLAIADNYVFWTDRRTSRLFWADIHETTQKIRRIEFSIFPNNTQLLVQAATHPDTNLISKHPCLNNPCSHICVQTPHSSTHHNLGYKCLCPPGLLQIDGKCMEVARCRGSELYCHKSNLCLDNSKRCDGKLDCKHGEDEEGCAEISDNSVKSLCSPHEILCFGTCVDKNSPYSCSPEKKHLDTTVVTTPSPFTCSVTEFKCDDSRVCVSRSQVCDGQRDCPDGSDEATARCDTLACFESEFMCASGSCILKTWKCDGDQDCNDASDEVDCENMSCPPGFYQCRDRECIELKKRCDGHQDCFDFSDEEDCDEPAIVEVKIDCPGGTDENACDLRCAPHGTFACKQEIMCLPMKKVCNGKKECLDGSDETPEACAVVNKTSHLYPPPLYPSAECHDGFLCGNGQCIEWREVCDHTPNCFDGSDEHGLCSSACDNNTCSHRCQPSPQGARCQCPRGYSAARDRSSCADVDECSAAPAVCSQRCHNVPGSFVCSCHRGYALRSDRRSCKAVRGNMSILYVSGNTVRSISADGYGAVEYSDPEIGAITDMDYDVRKNKLYVSSSESGNLIEVNGTRNVVTVSNVGRPTRVAVDWVTGNVYFADSTPSASCIRVCNIGKKRCAKLQKLPSDAKVTALIVEPASRRMFYCVARALESVVWSAALSGRDVTDLTSAANCTGLAADSFSRRLYLAETGPPHIISMDFQGGNHKKIVAEHPELQAPHGLSIFEDHIYYLVANSFRLSRCILYGAKHCETYIYRVFDANTFVVRHGSVQRDDLQDDCKGVACSNVCALDGAGPVCVCDDGSVAKDGNCELVPSSELPRFNGWAAGGRARSRGASAAAAGAVLALLALYLALFLYYHFVYKPRRSTPSAYTEVRFQNTQGDVFSRNSTIEIGAPQGVPGHEFVNPLQYVRNVWQQSIRKKSRPVCTAGLSYTVPHSPPQDFSDTESDLDDRETKRFIRSK